MSAATQPFAGSSDDLGMNEPPPYLDTDAPVVSADVDSARHRAAVARLEHELATIDRKLARLHDRRALLAAWLCTVLAAFAIVLAIAGDSAQALGIAATIVFGGAAIVLLAKTPRLRRDYRAVHDYLRRERRRFASMLADLHGERRSDA